MPGQKRPRESGGVCKMEGVGGKESRLCNLHQNPKGLAVNAPGKGSFLLDGCGEGEKDGGGRNMTLPFRGGDEKQLSILRINVIVEKATKRSEDELRPRRVSHRRGGSSGNREGTKLVPA